MHLPPALRPGARVALVAPCGPLYSAKELNVAVTQTESMGWTPVVGKHVLERHGYLAGTDEQRVDDLNAALNDDTIDGVWCLRGGYGAMRLLDQLDRDALRRRPKALIGYSDVTALHTALADHTQVITFHGPTARWPLTAYSRASLACAVTEHTDPCGGAPTARTLCSGRAAGRLVGGNLSLLSALVGTPYAPDYTDAILFLEDVGEETYRIDRMLRQLMLSGTIARLAGVVAGHFTEGTRAGDVSSIPLDDVLCEIAEAAGCPAIAGAPIGHIDDQWTLPMGATAELDADRRTLHVSMR